jgi:hypothetical protein
MVVFCSLVGPKTAVTEREDPTVTHPLADIETVMVLNGVGLYVLTGVKVRVGVNV